MKKIALISLLLTVIFIISGCSPSERPRDNTGLRYDEMQSIGNSFRSYDAENLEELEKYSEVIVRGYINDDSETVLQRLSDDKDSKEYNTILAGHTVSTLCVTEVYKGDINTGDSLKIAEPYYAVERREKNILIYSDNYLPSEIDGEYIFFLSAKVVGDVLKDVRFPLFSERGRYPIMRLQKRLEAYTNLELKLGTDDSEQYRDFYAQVKEKYMQ